MSHSRSQSRPPPKNPLPARFFRGAQLTFGWLLPQLSYILYLISYIFISLTSTFRFYNLVGEDIILPHGTSLELLARLGEFVPSSNLAPFNQTLRLPTWREATSLPYSGLVEKTLLKLRKAEKHIILYLISHI